MASLSYGTRSQVVTKALKISKEVGPTRRLFGNPLAVERLCAAPTYEDVLRCKSFRSNMPEVVFTGRANVGKSSLINALLGRNNMARTSVKPGKTKMLDFYGVGSLDMEIGSHRLMVVDSPGYGARGQPSWGRTFIDYVTNRDRLKRVYVCINISHEVKDYDISMLQQLEELCLASSRQTGQPLTFQTVLTKCDKLPLGDAGEAIKGMLSQIFKAAPMCLPPAALTSPKLAIDETGKKMGIDDLRHSIAEACGLV